MLKNQDTLILSEEQKAEIVERDIQYEAGEAKTYSLDEIAAYFNIK